MGRSKAIRKFCLACMCGSRKLVSECPSVNTCSLYPYRLGRTTTKKSCFSELKQEKVGSNDKVGGEQKDEA